MISVMMNLTNQPIALPNGKQGKVKPAECLSDLLESRTNWHLVLILAIKNCAITGISSKVYLSRQASMGICRIKDLFDYPARPESLEVVPWHSAAEVLTWRTYNIYNALSRIVVMRGPLDLKTLRIPPVHDVSVRCWNAQLFEI